MFPDRAEVKSQIVGKTRVYFALGGYQDVLYIGNTRREVETWLKENQIEQIKRSVEKNG